MHDVCVKRLGTSILGFLLVVASPSVASAAADTAEPVTAGVQTAELVVVGTLLGAGGALLMFVDRMQHGHMRHWHLRRRRS